MLNEIIEQVDKLDLRKYKNTKVNITDLENKLEKILSKDILKTIKNNYNLCNIFFDKVAYMYSDKNKLYLRDFNKEKIINIVTKHNFFEALVLFPKASFLQKFVFTKSASKCYVEINTSRKKYNRNSSHEKLIESRHVVQYDKDYNLENVVFVQATYIKKNDEYEFENYKQEEITNKDKYLLKMSRDSILKEPLFFKYIKSEYKKSKYNPFDVNNQKTIAWIKIKQQEYEHLKKTNIKVKKMSKIIKNMI